LNGRISSIAAGELEMPGGGTAQGFIPCAGISRPVAAVNDAFKIEA
jgi:hypothetical protein